MNSIILPPIKERVEDFETLEEQITLFFRYEIYLPLLRELGVNTTTAIQNTARQSDEETIAKAIQRGQIRFYRGQFKGAFNSKLSRALRSIGAEWDRTTESFLIPHSEITPALQQQIAVADSRFHRVAEKMNDRLAAVGNKIIIENLDMTKIFDKTLFKTEKDIKKTLKGITIQPQLSEESRARIASEYAKSLQIPIQEFVVKETLELRKRIIERSFAGYRYETLVAEIEKSYGVSQRKAKFLARQETSLLMTKFKQVRYQEAGSEEYIWGCVTGSPAHPVRHYHLLNKDKKFRWDTGAPINAAGDRKNPGQDYNCRCFARPIVRF